MPINNKLYIILLLTEIINQEDDYGNSDDDTSDDYDNYSDHNNTYRE